MIRLKGIEQHPRYSNAGHIIEGFNRYLLNRNYRLITMNVIAESYSKFRDPNNLVNEAIEEVKLVENVDMIEDDEFLEFKKLIVSFISSENDMNNHRGTLFEQIIRNHGPESTFTSYLPQQNSLEVARIYCETSNYNNGNCQKNVDIVFFDKGKKVHQDCFDVFQFIAYEIKCNINNFIKGIKKSTKISNDPIHNNNFAKLVYLKEMSEHFGENGKVFICTLNSIRAEHKSFFIEHKLDIIQIYEPI
ncbi:hypothetical protein [Sutcliffiella cohnii]|uniref:hypothetical protein n=1 Tax=Sutcliffiella cohnii TaxID=33932 RepID=UPI002E1E5180|nr:hypothetical protein [Sutcliffiella cohnii]